jgi:hypothetical protein
MTQHSNLKSGPPTGRFLGSLWVILACLILLFVLLAIQIYRRGIIHRDEIPGSYAYVADSAAELQRRAFYYVGKGWLTLHPDGTLECRDGELEVRMASGPRNDHPVITTIIPRGATAGTWSIKENGSGSGAIYVSLCFKLSGGSEGEWTCLWPERGSNGEVTLRPHLDPDCYITPLTRVASE